MSKVKLDKNPLLGISKQSSLHAAIPLVNKPTIQPTFQIKPSLTLRVVRSVLNASSNAELTLVFVTLTAVSSPGLC